MSKSIQGFFDTFKEQGNAAFNEGYEIQKKAKLFREGKLNGVTGTCKKRPINWKIESPEETFTFLMKDMGGVAYLVDALNESLGGKIYLVFEKKSDGTINIQFGHDDDDHDKDENRVLH